MDFEIEINQDGVSSEVVEVPGSSDRHLDRRCEPPGPGVVHINLRSIPLRRAQSLLGFRAPEEFTKLMQDLGIAEPVDGMMHVDLFDRLEMELQRRARVRAGMHG